MNNSNDLIPVAVNNVSAIPRRFFENSADSFMDAEAIDRLYEFSPQLAENPFSLFYGLMEKETEELRGVVWYNIDPLMGVLVVRFIAVDPEYRDKKIMPRIVEHGSKIAKQHKIKKIVAASQKNFDFFQTLYPDSIKETHTIVYKEV